MRATATSLLVRGESPARLVSSIREAVSGLGGSKPAGGLVLCAGGMATKLAASADALGRANLGFPLLLATGAGVITERGEVEGESAAAILLWLGGSADTWVVSATQGELSLALARELRARNEGGRSETALVFLRPNGVQPHTIEALQGLKGTRVIGAGTLSESDVYAVHSSGNVSNGAAGALTVRGLPTPLLATSPACKLLMPLREISAVRGSMVLSIEGEPALEVLSTVAHALVDQPLVFVALATERGQDSVRPPLLVRAVQGVDPARHGLIVSEEVKKGMRMAFAVRDAGAARADFEMRIRELARQAAGAAPRFGVCLNCAGRGIGLYKNPDTDLRMLKARFGEIPWVGLFSSFEIAPHGDEPALQLYSSVVALFTSPS
ncbi:MAG TPA: FIST C-terminal domain-containing protein [Polyangiaceae bacterium]|nr:FIST C-terminal domain-containing protein [Polyangiaceae bacterium]